MKITRGQKILIERIKELCREKGMTHYRLSYKSTVPLTTMNNILNGKSNNPGIFTIMKICDGLEISLEEFFGTKQFRDLFEEEKTEE